MSCVGILCTLVVEIATIGWGPPRPAADPHPAVPTRAPAQVVEAAERYLKSRGIDSSDRLASTPEYSPRTGSWLITYAPRGAEPRALGEGAYGVFVSDRDLTRVRLSPSR